MLIRRYLALGIIGLFAGLGQTLIEIGTISHYGALSGGYIRLLPIPMLAAVIVALLGDKWSNQAMMGFSQIVGTLITLVTLLVTDLAFWGISGTLRRYLIRHDVSHVRDVLASGYLITLLFMFGFLLGMALALRKRSEVSC